MTHLIFNYTVFIPIAAFQKNLPRETKRKQSNFYDLPAVWVQGSWTPRAPSDLPWPGFGERSPPSRHGVYSGLAFFSLIREGAGRTSGMMAVNFRLFTTQDWSLTSEWTHLNREIARPQLHRPCLFTALCTQSHSSQLFLPLSFFISVFTVYQFNTWSRHQFRGHF